MFFFFSSRRRHTRWPRDWSSDVCSSDLPSFRGHGGTREPVVEKTYLQEWHYYFANTCRWRELRKITIAQVQGNRSEERRVGKECRYRWTAYHTRERRQKESERHCMTYKR